MATEPCLWCGRQISEKALTCPKCHAHEPFNSIKKAATDNAAAKEKERQDALDKTYPCPECGSKRRFEDISKKPTCPQCGHPGAGPRCAKCSKSAEYYDEEHHAIVCENHTVENCSHCNRPIREGDKVISRGGNSYGRWRYAYHETCTPEYRESKKSKEFNTWAIIVFVVIILAIAKCSS